jgi:hypothetical protein
VCGGLLVCLPLACSSRPEAEPAAEEGRPAPVTVAPAHLVKGMPGWSELIVADQGQPDTGNVAVKVRFPNDCGLRSNAVLHVEVQTQPPSDRLVIPDAAVLEDQTPPAVFVAAEKTEKNDKGEEEKHVTARKLRLVAGVRDRQKHEVEVLRLEDDKGEPVPADGLQYIVGGVAGLKDGDELKIEEPGHDEKE